MFFKTTCRQQCSVVLLGNVCEVINVVGVADASSGMHQTDLRHDVSRLQTLLAESVRMALVAVTRQNSELPVLQVRG